MPDDELNQFRFLYFDRARTHKLWTSVERRNGGLSFVSREAPYESTTAADQVTREQRIGVPWAAKLAIHDVETRLATSGVPYYRLHPPTRRVDPLPVAAEAVDLRAHEFALPGAPDRKALLHHFHHGLNNRSVLQFTLPRSDIPGADRYLMASVSFDALNPAAAEVEVVHSRLAPGTLRSAWVNQHVDLPRRGFKKLVKAVDYALAFGDDWAGKWRSALGGAFSRMFRGGEPAAHAAPAAVEVDAPTPFPEGITLEEAMGSDLLARIRARHLAPAEARAIFERDELAIRRFVGARRRRYPDPDEQARISLLEASLLVEYGQRVDRPDLVQREGPRVVRLVADFTGLHRRKEAPEATAQPTF